MADAVQGLSAALADRYAIERELGAGVMTAVYFAHDVHYDSQSATRISASSGPASRRPIPL